jgi:uncharacterized protein (TIGR04255 family)
MMNGFFFQVGLPLDAARANASITQTILEPLRPGQVSILLDIELSRTEGLIGENDLWPLFETLRVWKNKVFEGCITDATRELIR